MSFCGLVNQHCKTLNPALKWLSEFGQDMETERRLAVHREES